MTDASQVARVWFSIEELAERLDLSPHTIRKLRFDGNAPRGVRVGKRVRFHVDDVVAWEQQQREAAS